jgi:hypothetical protein
MSASNAPTYYFTGIQFNSAFYNVNDTTLTQSQASSLYLLKNTPDTATALETFSGGIKTDSILPTTTTGQIIVGTASTFTDLKGAVKASNTFQTPSIDPILGGGNFNVGCGTLSTVNLGTNLATAVNIGSGSIVTNIYGIQNLARNVGGTSDTYIETYSLNNANAIDFHSSGTNAVDYDSRIATFGGGATDGQGTMEIVTGTLNIQNDATTGGSINIKNGTTSTGNINIKSGLGSAGNINIYNGLSSGGDVNIKSGATASGAINIANNTGTVTTNIGTSTGTGAITIGSATNSTNLNCATLNIQNDASTPGTINIKNGTSSTGNINIKSGTTASGSINIANSTGTVTTNIGAGTGTGTVTIGNSANTVQINGTLALGTGRNISLSGTVKPVAGQLGYVLGISRIFINKLKEMDVYERPLHCTDYKRETVYIKNEDTWEKDNQEKSKLRHIVSRIARKNLEQLPAWQNENPDYVTLDTPENNEFLKISLSSLGGYSNDEENKHVDKIMRNVLKEVVVSKSCLLDT